LKKVRIGRRGELIISSKGSTFMHNNGTFHGKSYMLKVQLDNIMEKNLEETSYIY